MPNLLSKIFPRTKGPAKVDIFAAVVDQIPYPPNCYPLPNVPEWRLGPNGFEGFSVAVAYSDHAAPDLWSQSNVKKAPALESALQRPVLSFRFPAHENTACLGTASHPAKSTTLHGATPRGQHAFLQQPARNNVCLLLDCFNGLQK